MKNRPIIVTLSLIVLFFVSSGCNHSKSGKSKQDNTSTQSFKSSDEASLSTKSKTVTPQRDAERISQKQQDATKPRRDRNIAQSRDNAITQAVQKVSPAVVSITVTEMVKGRSKLKYNKYYNRFFTKPVQREVSSMGSGFIINQDGLVVTNQHVANKNAKKIVVSLTDGSQYEAKLLGADELSDLALLKIKGDHKFPTVEFGNSDSVAVGEWSLAVGNPFGLFKATQPSVTVGVVSAKNRDFRPNPNKPRVYIDMVQTDAAINHGNSGGPLVDSRGHVIGVNTFIFTGGTSNGNVGLGFAIPSNRAQKIINQLSSSGGVELSYDPGFETKQMTYNLAAKYDLPAVMGLLVQSVNRDGPAYEAGVIPGDIILKVGDNRVQSKMHAQALFREYAEGDSMHVELVRDEKRYETKIMLRRKTDN